MMKVAFITSAFSVTTNPYTEVYFNILISQISVLLLLAQRDVYQAVRTAKQEWPLLWLTWPVKEDFCPSASALCEHVRFHIGTFFFFLLLNSEGPGSTAESGTLRCFLTIM